MSYQNKNNMKTYKRHYADLGITRYLDSYVCNENPAIEIKVEMGGGWYGGQPRAIGYNVMLNGGLIRSVQTLKEAKEIAEEI